MSSLTGPPSVDQCCAPPVKQWQMTAAQQTWWTKWCAHCCPTPAGLTTAEAAVSICCTSRHLLLKGFSTRKVVHHGASQTVLSASEALSKQWCVHSAHRTTLVKCSTITLVPGLSVSEAVVRFHCIAHFATAFRQPVSPLAKER